MNGLYLNAMYFCEKFDFDTQWDFAWRHIGGMMNSHFYDVITYAGAFVACAIMFFVKKHIKIKWVNILLVSFMSLGIYGVCATLSERLRMNSNWTLVAFVAPMAYLTIIGLLRREWIYRVIVYSTALFIGAYNYIYCIINEDHHKMCYTLKWFIIAFGIGGYVKNIVGDVKRKKSVASVIPENEKSGEADTSPEQES
ncbi:MAG: hypothetical protein J5783_04450 [Lachnospiraceae bacterium]|nr:hypothetical protein [Lachnospiraceae bacterium]